MYSTWTPGSHQTRTPQQSPPDLSSMPCDQCYRSNEVCTWSEGRPRKCNPCTKKKSKCSHERFFDKGPRTMDHKHPPAGGYVRHLDHTYRSNAEPYNTGVPANQPQPLPLQQQHRSHGGSTYVSSQPIPAYLHRPIPNPPEPLPYPQSFKCQRCIELKIHCDGRFPFRDGIEYCSTCVQAQTTCMPAQTDIFGMGRW